MNLEALRKKESRLVIGLMSGTSCDGIDAALVRVTGSGPATQVELLAFETAPYPQDLREHLLKAPHLDAAEVCTLNFLLGEDNQVTAPVTEIARAEATVKVTGS